MTRQADYILTPYDRRHRQAVLDLLFQSNRIHTHLDWHDAGAWLDLNTVPAQLAWDEHGRLAAIMASSEVWDGLCWLRLMAVANAVSAQAVMPQLWNAMANDLRSQGIQAAHVLAINDWLLPLLDDSLGFTCVDEIITLRRDGPNLPPFSPDALMPPVIRLAEDEDLPEITHVDQTAFESPWQLTASDLRRAKRIAALCTVAIYDDRIVGYQLSTLFRQSAHLARLAVLPEAQRGGVGSALVDHMIRQFLKRGVRSITVNTQLSNLKSQRLYERYGFQRNGYDLSVWQNVL